MRGMNLREILIWKLEMYMTFENRPQKDKPSLVAMATTFSEGGLTKISQNFCLYAFVSVYSVTMLIFLSLCSFLRCLTSNGVVSQHTLKMI